MAALGSNMKARNQDKPEPEKSTNKKKKATSKKAGTVKAKTVKKTSAQKEVAKPVAKKKATKTPAKESKVKAKEVSSAPQPKIDVPKLRNAKLILEPSKRKKIRKIRVILEGDLTINNVDAFKTEIEPVFNDFDFVDFLHRDVTSLDLCHIQLMYQIQQHYETKSKTVTIDADLPTDLKKVVVNAGFKELMFIPKLV